MAWSKEQLRLYRKSYRDSHKEESKLYYKKYYKTNHERIKSNARAYAFKIRYGITIEEKDLIAKKQKNRCAICRVKFGKQYVDHNHLTGVIRGLLCLNCNVMLGHAKDSPSILLTAAGYLTN